MMARWISVLLIVILSAPTWAQSPTSKSSALPTATPAEVGLDATKLGNVRETIESFVENQEIAGAVFAIARHGKLVEIEAVGWKDLEDSEPMKRDTIFRIYSMTKPIVSAAAMTLVEDGKLKLDDPVSKYIPEFAAAEVYVSGQGEDLKTEPLKRAVTVRDLLRHSSGLTYGFFSDTPVDRMYRAAGVMNDNEDNGALASKAASIPLLFQPGTRFHYGVSVDVLGHVIEVASGKTLDEYLQSTIFDPLQMDDTGFFVPKEDRARFANSYTAKPNGGIVVIDDASSSKFLSKPALLSGGGGLVSTADDYMRFALMMLGGGELNGTRVLSEQSVAEMTKNQLPSSALPIQIGVPMVGTGFGLGFSVVVADDPPSWVGVKGEYGWDGMASTHYWASPEHDLAVVVLTQRQPFSGQVEAAVKPIVYDAVKLSSGRAADR